MKTLLTSFERSSRRGYTRLLHCFSNECRFALSKLSVLIFILLLGFGSQAWATNSFWETYMTYEKNGEGKNYTFSGTKDSYDLGIITTNFKITNIYYKCWDDWNDYSNPYGGIFYKINGGDQHDYKSYDTKDWKSGSNNFEIYKNGGMNLTIASSTNTSGKYSMKMFFEVNGNSGYSKIKLDNDGKWYEFIYTILPPTVSGFTSSVANSGGGDGGSSTPYIVFYNQDVMLTVSATACPDANAKLQFSFDNGTNWVDADANNQATTTIKTQATSSNATQSVKYRYYNSADDLSGTVGETTINYRSAKYDITLNANTGTAGDWTSPYTYYGYNVIKGTYVSSQVSKTGYHFDGWYKESTQVNLIADTDKDADFYANTDYTNADGRWKVTEGKTLYAGWTANTYKVILDKGGSTTGVGQVTATYDADMPSATMPSLTGYDFAGYFESQNGQGTKYYNADGTSAHIWNKAASTTIYAYWTPKKYTVTFNQTYATTQGTTSVEATYNATLPAIASLPSRTGYTFGGYNTNTPLLLVDNNGAWQSNVSGFTDENGKWIKTTGATLDPVWNAKSTTVTMKANGGKEADQTFTATFDAVVDASDKTANTRDGYDLKGYYNAATGGNQILESNLAVKTNAVSGWLGTGGTWKNPNATADIFAQWTAHQWTITLDDNEGSGGSGSKTATYGLSAGITSVTKPTRTNYTFAGYYDDQAGEGVQVYDVNGDLVTGASGYTDGSRNWICDHAVTLYAKWNSIGNYVVTLDPLSGATTPGTASVNVIINTTTGLTENITPPTKTGYTFGGYFTETGGGGTQLINANGSWITNVVNDYIDEEGKWKYGGNVTLKAKWDANQTTVTFDKQYGKGGTGSRTLTYNSTNFGEALVMPTRGGFTFGGYYTEPDGKGVQLITDGGAWIAGVAGYTDTPLKWIKTTTTPLTIYAKWTEIKYNLKVTHQYYDCPGKGTKIESGIYAPTSEIVSTTFGAKTGYSIDASGASKPGFYHTKWVLNKNATIYVGDQSTSTTTDTKTINGSKNSDISLSVDSGYATFGTEVNVLDRWREYERTLDVFANNGTIQGDSADLEGIGVYTAKTVVAIANIGYKFAEWIIDPTSTNYTIILEAPTSATTPVRVSSDVKTNKSKAGSITANFTPITYKITYANMEGATNFKDAPANYNIESTTISLGTPAKTGYTFKGWKRTNASGEVITEIAHGSIDDITLWATWTEDMHIITIEGGTEGSTEAGIATTGSATAATAATGYTWDKWTIPAENFTLVNCSVNSQTINFNATAAGTVTATYTLNQHQLTWNLNGGTVKTAGTADGLTDYGTTLTAPIVEKTGYTFAGWSDGSAVVTPAATMPDNALTYTAQWTINNWGIGYNGEHVTYTAKPTSADYSSTVTFSFTVDAGYKLTHVYVLTAKQGNPVDGVSNEGNTYTFPMPNEAVSIAVVAEEDLSTNWKVGYKKGSSGTWNEYDFLKKTGESAGNIAYYTASLDANSHYLFKVIKNSPTKTYYGNTNSKDGETASEKYWIKGDVANWTFETDKEDCNMKTNVAGNYTFKIDFSGSNPKVSVIFPTSYTISYGSNLSVVPDMTSSSVVPSGTQLVFTATNREEDGYTFDGFYKDGDKTEPVTEGTVDGYTYTVTPTADLHVHAKYTPTVYNITYNVDGGDPVSTNLTYNVETETFNLPTPTKSGYAFKGWFTNEACTEGQTTQIAKGSTGNKTFYAKWVQEGLYLNVKYADNDWQLFRMNDNEGTSITKAFAKGKTYTFSIREVINGQEYIWWKHDGTWTGTAQKDLSTSGNDGKFQTLTAIDGNYTFAVDKSANPYKLTITYPSFTCEYTTTYDVVPNEAFNMTITPSATGFTPTYKLFVQKDGAGEWSEVTTHKDNVYTYTPSGQGSYIFKARAYANENDYLEASATKEVKVAGLSVEATRQSIPVGLSNQLTATTNYAEGYVCYTLTGKPDGSTKTNSDIAPIVDTKNATFVADVIGDYEITATLRDAACGSEGRTLATTTYTITAIEQYKVYFKKTAKDWGSDAYVYFNPTWTDNGVTNYEVRETMTLVEGETDVYVANVPDNMATTRVVFAAKSFEKNTTFTECLVAYRQDFDKDYPYFVQDPQHKGNFGTCYSYGDGRWFRYATDKGYKLVVGTTEYPLTFPSEASIVPAAIPLNMEANQTLALTLTNTQGSTFYLPAYLEISNHDNLVMTTTTNENKFLTASAGTYNVSVVFNSNVMPVISSTFPEVPAPSATFTEQRIYNDAPIAFISGDGTEGNPYKFFTDEKMTLTISALPEVKGLAAQYKFGDAEASETNTVDITSATATAVTPITMETYYKKGSAETEHTTKTIYYQVLGVPVLHLTSTATNNEVNFDSWTATQISYRADNYSGAATITLNSADWKTPSGASQDYTCDKPANPMFLKYKATANYGGREFTADLKVVAYRNVLVKMEDVDDAINAKRVHMWRDGAGTAEGTTWPGVEFTTLFGHWKVFNMKYPVYDRWIVNDNDIKKYRTETQSIDGTKSEICCKTGTSAMGTGKDDDKRFFQVVYQDVECPGHILVDDIDAQKVDKDASILVAPNVYLMTGVQASDITMEITTSNDNVTVTQNGMALLVTGNKAGETTVTVNGYYRKGLSGEELVTKTFNVIVTAMITVQVKVPTNFQWNNHDDMWIYYFNHGLTATHVKMTWKDCVDSRDRFYARIPLGSDGKVDFLFHEWELDGSTPWQQTTNVENVTESTCYRLEDGGSGQKRNWFPETGMCWTDTKYQVLINMNSGTEYRSNKLTSTDGTLSFFAPGKNETGYKGGLVRLMNDGVQVAVIPTESFATSGVYTATINSEGTGIENIALYTGDYYIRTDKAPGGWNGYKVDGNKFTQFAMLDGEIYDHYWVKNIKKTGDETKFNLQACVGNEYNENLANKIVGGLGTEDNGDISPDDNGANVRFAYNPATNYFDRAILTGSSSNEFLNIVGMTDNIYKTYEGNVPSTPLNEAATAANSKFQDGSSWTYTKTIYAKIDGSHTTGSIRIKAKAFNGEVTYLLGYETNEVTGEVTSTPVNRTILATGTTNGTYQLSTIYDFKTNRIVTAWTPLGEMMIENELIINADIMFVRHEQEDAAHIILGENGSVKSLENVYFVLELDRDDAATSGEEGHYWFSLPFDCKLSQVFGVPGYMETWGIQYYDGAARAKNGFWIDSESYFKWFTKEDFENPETILHAGEGYVLSFDKSVAPWAEYDKKAILRLYFPSKVKGFDMNNSKPIAKTYKDEPCTITRDNRDKKDGNWKIIGSMAYNNSKPETVVPSEYSQSQEFEGKVSYPKFLYEFSEGNIYTPVDGTDYTYRAFFGYRVQFGGTILWKPQTETQPEQGLAARRKAAPGEVEHLTTRLELQKADGTKADQTFIALDINASTGYDQNMDLGKIISTTKNQVYTTSESVDYAGNTLPMESQTVAVTVNTKSAGSYTFAMPDGTEGVEMILIDSETQTQTNLALNTYQVELGKGNFANRFSIRINLNKVVTSVENAQSGENTDATLKYIENDHLYIQRGSHVFDANGIRVK